MTERDRVRQRETDSVYVCVCERERNYTSAMVHAKLVLALIVTAIVENVMANPVFFALEKMPHKPLAVHKNGRAANSRHN